MTFAWLQGIQLLMRLTVEVVEESMKIQEDRKWESKGSQGSPNVSEGQPVPNEALDVERGNMDKVKKSHEHVETKWKKYEESV